MSSNELVHAVQSRAEKYRPTTTPKPSDNRAVSKVLGDRWTKLSDDEKRVYCDRANQVKHEHYRKYPDCKWGRSGKKLSSSNSKKSERDPLGSVEETVADPLRSTEQLRVAQADDAVIGCSTSLTSAACRDEAGGVELSSDRPQDGTSDDDDMGNKMVICDDRTSDDEVRPVPDVDLNCRENVSLNSDSDEHSDDETIENKVFPQHRFSPVTCPMHPASLQATTNQGWSEDRGDISDSDASCTSFC